MIKLIIFVFTVGGLLWPPTVFSFTADSNGLMPPLSSVVTPLDSTSAIPDEPRLFGLNNMRKNGLSQSTTLIDTAKIRPFSALGFDGMPNRVGIDIAGTGGGFYRVQEPESSMSGGFHAKGFQQNGNWLLYGSMDVGQQKDATMKWVAQSPTILNQPYQWADSSSADWTRRRIGLQGALLTPHLWDRNLRAGVQVHHFVEQGSTRQDPRPLYRHTRYGVRAGLTSYSDSRGTINGYLGFSTGNEESEIGFYSRTNPRVFYFRGLATMSVANVVRATRTWQENMFDIGFEWQKDRFLLNFEARYRDQENHDGTANPVFAGGYNVTELHARVSVPITTKLQLRFISGFYYGEGTDPLFNQVNINATGLQNTLNIGRSFNWSAINYVELHVGHDYINHEDIVGFASYEIQHLRYGIRTFTALHKVSGHPSLKLEVVALEKLDGTYIRERPNLLTNRITDPQVQYLMASQIQFAIEIGYSLKIGALPIRLIGGGNHVIATRYAKNEESGRSRTMLQAKMMITF